MDDLKQIRISMIEPDPMQPRKDFNKEELEELAASIRQYGVLQPILVKPSLIKGFYTIIAGERRWRAAKIANLTQIPAIIVEESERRVREISLIENIQRSDLNPIDEARGYRKLIEDYHLTQDDIAEKVSKSRTYIANSLRLLQLPPAILTFIKEGKISAGHGRALLSLPLEDRLKTAEEIVKEDLTVREIEKRGKEKRKKKKEKEIIGEEYYREIEREMTEKMERKVEVKVRGGGGQIILSFYDLDDLEVLLYELRRGEG